MPQAIVRSATLRNGDDAGDGGGCEVTACACDGTLAAVAYASGAVELWGGLLSSEPRVLAVVLSPSAGGASADAPSDHRCVGRIAGVALRDGLLVVCAEEGAYTWAGAPTAAASTAVKEDAVVHEIDVGSVKGCESGLGPALAACVAAGGSLAAVSYGRTVLVWDVAGDTCVAVLEGHQAAVHCLRFSDVLPDAVITAGHDRCFSVWDYREGAVVYRSCVLAASPILSVAEQRRPHRLVLGFADGALRIVDAEDGYRLLHTAQLAKLHGEKAKELRRQEDEAVASSAPKRITSLPPWKQQQPQGSAEDSPAEAEAELGHCVLALACCDDEWFVAATSYAVAAVRCSTFEANVLHIPDGDGDGATPFAAAALAPPVALGAAAFVPRLQAYRVLLDTDAGMPHPAAASASAAASDAAAPSIYLRAPLPRRLAAPLVAAQARPAKPAVFHSNVKSSGYASAVPWSVAKQQKQQKQQQLLRRRASGGGRATYVPFSGVPCAVQRKQGAALADRSAHSGAVTSVVFTDDARHLLTASADRLACFLKLPAHRHSGDAHVFKGHTAPLTAACVTHAHGDAQAVLTAGLDGAAMLWRPGREAPCLTLQKKAEVRACAFLNVDRLAVVASRGAIDLHSFALDGGPRAATDLDRHTNRSTQRLVLSVPTDNQAVTCVAAHNSFPSGLVFFSGSSGVVAAYDVCAERCVVRLANPHTRPVQRLGLASACQHAGHPAGTLEVFTTSAPDGVVKLWDLRCTSSAVRSFASHVNKVHAVGTALSPCMRFLATGSEDRCTYVYEVATGKVVSKVHSHSDVVSCVAFNPLFPQLVSGGHDGKLSFISDEQ